MRSPFAALLLAALAGPAAAQGPAPSPAPSLSLLDSLKQGQVKAVLRYRFESVSDDAVAEDAQASTLRLALSYETRAWKRMAALVQFENVTDLGLGEHHMNGATGPLATTVSGRPVIGDPEVTGVNQALLRFTPGRSTLEAGRFTLELDTERFVGSVGFRQNQQSLDGGRFEQRFGGERGRAMYAFVGGVNRVFGDRKPMASHVGWASYEPAKGHRLHATVLVLDYDRAVDASLSTATAAVGAMGARKAGKGKLLYDLELGWQQDAADNPKAIDEPYARAELGYEQGTLGVRAGWELLGGSLEVGHGAFSTPLATLHRWNGWADKFLATPAAGLRDAWGALLFSRKAVKAQLVFHDFRADDGGAHYGTEWDALVSYDFSWKQQIGAKAAFYQADELAKDTTKVWLYTSWAF